MDANRPLQARIALQIALELQASALEVELDHLAYEPLARLLLGRALVPEGDLLAPKDQTVEIEGQGRLERQGIVAAHAQRSGV